MHATQAEAACDPGIFYQLVKGAVLEQEPSTAAEFDRMMSKLGLSQDGHIWKCENAEGTLLVGFSPWLHLDYTPNKPEKVPDALLSILAARAHAQPAGPHWINFEYQSDKSTIAAFKSSAEITETITIDLVGGIYEGTQCTIKMNAKAPR